MLAPEFFFRKYVTKLVLAATNIKKGKKMKNLMSIFFVAVIGGTLGYAIGNSFAVQSSKVKQICQCDEDCQCCASCSCSHGE